MDCVKALPIVLDALSHHKVKATFFVLGRFVNQNPMTVEEIVSNGHVLGCHGFSHYPPYDERKFTEVCRDVEKGTRIVCKFGDVANFRSPYFRPHQKLIAILENLNYSCDSSVPSKRFDFFLGRTTNLYNMICPSKPYYPSKGNIFTRGESKILEIPLSGLVFPLLGTTMRNFGFQLFTRLVDVAGSFSDVIVFDVHTWEFVEATDAKLRHKRRRGRQMVVMFDKLLQFFKRKSRFVTFSDLTK